MRQFAPEFTAEMGPLLDPKKGIESREIPGGTGPESVRAALAQAREVVARLPK